MKMKLVILALLLLISFSNQLYACSCIGHSSLQQDIKRSNTLVVGTVLNKQIITLIDSSQMLTNDATGANSILGKMRIARCLVFVERIYKGNITSDTLTIYTGIGNGDCGVRFEVGEKYIIYGNKETYFGQVNNNYKFPKGKNTFWTNMCQRTSLFIQEELIEIEKFAKNKKRTRKTNS